MTAPPPPSMDDLSEHIRDIRTALTALGYALGRQPVMDADALRSDMLELCMDLQPPAATELVILIAQAALRGSADRAR